ncbi:uncharacterized protein LOC122026535 [Zingiber officinale]|uniref:uncharacterized protein LOC122026535 n=1 Tax=Zingiber officinale TaxID=94328 RepID=UPI001C4C3246|nr:uncharacterized protein LOC122026535 [Zingiber officinale]
MNEFIWKGYSTKHKQRQLWICVSQKSQKSPNSLAARNSFNSSPALTLPQLLSLQQSTATGEASVPTKASCRRQQARLLSLSAGPPVRNPPPTVDGNRRLLPTTPSHLRREILLRLRRSSSNILLRLCRKVDVKWHHQVTAVSTIPNLKMYNASTAE